MTDGGAVEFDGRARLPEGQLAIEASAGTGKTYALTGLAMRYLAEGRIVASELLVVTYTRAATEELRARLRERLATAVAHLEDGHELPAEDELLAFVCAQDQDLRAQRLSTALSEFDSVTITTIHGFARQMHRMLGISGDIDPDAELVSNAEDLVVATCTDILAQEASAPDIPGPLPELGDLVRATTEALRRPGIDVQPDPGQPKAKPVHVTLRRLVLRAIDECARRRTEQAVIGFDDLLAHLRDAIHDPVTGPGVVGALRNRYKVALIDEFQDTDAVQWDIFSSLFAVLGTGNVLITVGDPKQAIYRFRGADVHTYLDAVGEGSGVRRETLGTNWRSDEPVLRSLEALLAGATFGDPLIPFTSVGVSDPHIGRRIRIGSEADPPVLDVRAMVRDDVARTVKDSEVLIADAARDAVAEDLAAYIASLLSGAEVPGKEPGTVRSVVASDIAVLVTRNIHAERLQRELVDAGIPAVVAADGTVLGSRAAVQLRMLLRAMARPFDPALVHSYASSWFVDWTPERIAAASDAEWMGLQEDLATWAGLLGTEPVAEVFARIWGRTLVIPRVIGTRDGDRHVTDLEHLVELLHDAAPRGRSAVPGLLAVLETPPDVQADTEVDGNVTARRIESDSDAVQIMTIWKAKGLEFPIVCVPTLWWPPPQGLTVFADRTPTGGVQWVLDLANGKDWPDRTGAAARRARGDAEVAGEQLRLLYVALTRAHHLTAVWWANRQSSKDTALAHLLFARDGADLDATAFGAPSVTVPPAVDLADALQPVVDAATGTIAVTILEDPPVPPVLPERSVPSPTEPDEFHVASFDRVLDRSVHRWSFSSLTRHIDEIGSDPYDDSGADRGAGDEAGFDDALGFGPPAHGEPETGNGTSMPFAEGDLLTLPAGTEFGTLVHSVLERADFTADPLTDELDRVAGIVLADGPVDLTPRDGADGSPGTGRDLLASGLADALQAPLGPLFDGDSLVDLRPGDRLDETDFDLRLAGGGARATMKEIAGLVRSHLASDDPLRTWADAFAASAPGLELAGFLTGSIDLIARVGSGDGAHFVVVDYKTNQLVPRGVDPSRGDYSPAALATAMAAHHYPVQALLYSVALHRYLRWRLPGYRPEDHLGGAAYLFLRGMTTVNEPADDGASLGVFSWPIPPDLVLELSDLLAGRPEERDTGG